MKLNNKILRNFVKVGYVAAEFFWENSEKDERSGEIKIRPLIRLKHQGLFISPWLSKAKAEMVKENDGCFFLMIKDAFVDDYGWNRPVAMRIFPDEVNIWTYGSCSSSIPPDWAQFCLTPDNIDGKNLSGYKRFFEKFLEINNLMGKGVAQSKINEIKTQLEKTQGKLQETQGKLQEKEEKLSKAQEELNSFSTPEEAKNNIIAALKNHKYRGLLKKPIFSYKRLKNIVAKMIESEF